MSKDLKGLNSTDPNYWQSLEELYNDSEFLQAHQDEFKEGVSENLDTSEMSSISRRSTLLGIPDPLVNARENGIFRSYKINGIPSLSILIIPAITTILHLTIVAILITTTAPLLFDAPLPINWLNYIMIVLSTALACAGISVLNGVGSPSSRMTVLWSQIIFVPSMMLGGLMLPFSMLPAVAGMVARLLPATQAHECL